MAGAGDDVLVVSDLPIGDGGVVDGGDGRDILALDFGGTIDGDLLATLSVSAIEAIDMENGLVNELALSLADVIDQSETADTELEALLGQALPESVVIYGDAGDTLVLSNDPGGGFTQVSNDPVVDTAGNSLMIFQYVEGGNILATLGVEDDITVTMMPTA